jgi:sterol desaturase/sphingolipid hydroxylase (fatty acid hydroxylase superfamily)
MHRIHHSARRKETDSNYGGVLPWHDHLFGTYIDEPVCGHEVLICTEI